MSFQADDRVLIKPLSVAGTVIRPAASGHGYVVQADSGGPPVVWRDYELEPLATPEENRAVREELWDRLAGGAEA